ncbi:alkaline phosphatase family protein [Agrococcus jejuensis]|uniref:Type I phosphodiesterase / nucleotide pyrophosphatase n=1 Tax=Agrococcus jejuensis TaxID=399736 RepID=A0A1G7ZV36_9MICO|nr:alkaline phosphatase family protein [Agrococcus jejuensis]SDH12565.1 Type I phosphodiesterase / nucleotide pyrophosphatase [Agrococcus jejuensis]
MLPAASPAGVRLADVLASQVLSASGARNALGLPRARRSVIVVVDGLGVANLNARAGHARTLVAGPRKGIVSGFPTTTAAALTSLYTGTTPGQHGIVGYDALVPGVGVRNQLRDWGGAMDPETWQRSAPLLADVQSTVVNEPRYADSGFTRATLRGADYVAARTIDDRIDAAIDAVHARDGIVSCYVPDLDRIGHEQGWQSDAWIDALERLDGAVARLADRIPAGAGILVTADHGMVDVPEHKHLIVPPALLEGVAHVAGEPRCLQLHRDPSHSGWEATVDAWRAAFGDVAWIATRDELVASGWLGEVDDAVLPRIGDLVVAMRGSGALYVRDDDPARGMVGQHGSFTSEELRVPLVRLGAYAGS